MKKNKIVVLAGMALLTVGTILNVHDALNEFGVMEISLHPQVMAQTGGVNGTTTGFGEQLTTEVECEKSSSSTSTSSTSTGARTDANVNGGISAGNGVIGGSIGGGYTVGSTSSSGTTTVTNDQSSEKFKAKKYYCGKFEYIKICSITNPCKQ